MIIPAEIWLQGLLIHPPMGQRPTQPSWQAVSQDTVLAMVAALDLCPTTVWLGTFLHWQRGASLFFELVAGADVDLRSRVARVVES